MLVEKTPVLILAFNRDDKFKMCIKNLFDNGFRNIYLSVDGPRNVKDSISQSKIKSIFDEYAALENCNFRSNFIKSNLGCRKGVIRGISWFFEQVKFGLIIEDDVLISNNVCKAFCELLEEYETDNEIMSISSFNEFIFNEKSLITKSPVFRSWGWATWAKEWKEHIKFSEKIEKLTLRQCLKYLPRNFQNIKNVEIVKACHLGFIDTWDYEYNFTHIALSKFSITFTGQNCINIGFDEDATHTKDLSLNNIDFSEFKNNPIDTKKEIILDKNSLKLLLENCGFFENNRFHLKFKLFNFLLSYKYSFIFYLRKLKRIIIKK